jgi:hypothetical protein
MLVTGSVQVEVDVVEEELEEVVVQVMAVLVAAAPQDVRLGRAASSARNRTTRLTEPRPSPIRIAPSRRSFSNRIPENPKNLKFQI